MFFSVSHLFSKPQCLVLPLSPFSLLLPARVSIVISVLQPARPRLLSLPSRSTYSSRHRRHLAHLPARGRQRPSSVNVSLLLRHALGLGQLQELGRWLAEAAGEGGDHPLPQARVRVKVYDGVEHGRGLANQSQM